MPSSYIDSVAPIMHLVIELQPKRIVDVGPGWGKYGLMCREFLPDLEQLWAVEVTPGRIETQDVIYDKIIEDDVRNYDQVGWPWIETDLVLMIDVIEHMPRADGHLVLNAMLHSGAKVLVSTPQVWVEQHDDHNPYEEHISLWSWPKFRPHGIERDVSTIDSIIYLLKGER
jgi:hypothetical protein